MRRFVLGSLLVSGVAGAAPPADPLLGWVCANPSLPHLPAPGVRLPPAASEWVPPTARPRIAELHVVDATGAVTVHPVGPDGVVDVGAPAAAVLAELRRGRHLALGPVSWAPAPADPAVAARLAELANGAGPLGVAGCPAASGWLEREPEPCADQAAALAPVLAACPARRADLLALLLAERGQPLAGEPVVLVEVVRGMPPVDVPADTRWGDVWDQAVLVVTGKLRSVPADGS